MSAALRRRYGHAAGIDPARLTERGLAAVAAARMGMPLYVFRAGEWRTAGSRALAHAEKLAWEYPAGLTMYAAERH